MKRLGLLIYFLAAPAAAQQLPDVPTLQVYVAVLQQQRNEAMDRAATADVKAAMQAEELRKLKADLDRLKNELAAHNTKDVH